MFQTPRVKFYSFSTKASLFLFLQLAAFVLSLKYNFWISFNVFPFVSGTKKLLNANPTKQVPAKNQKHTSIPTRLTKFSKVFVTKKARSQLNEDAAADAVPNKTRVDYKFNFSVSTILSSTWFNATIHNIFLGTNLSRLWESTRSLETMLDKKTKYTNTHYKWKVRRIFSLT